MTALTAVSADVAIRCIDKCWYLAETRVGAAAGRGRSEWVSMVLLFPVYSTHTQRPSLPVIFATRNDMDKYQQASRHRLMALDHDLCGEKGLSRPAPFPETYTHPT